MNMKIFKLFLLTTMSFVITILSSCSHDDDIPSFTMKDYMPVVFEFNIENHSGQNIFQTGLDVNYEDFSLVYDGHEFKPITYDEYYDMVNSTRYFMASIQGFIFYNSDDTPFPYFTFGFFDGMHCEETFNLIMPDGKSHEIYINRYRDDDDTLHQIVKLDNKIVEEYTNKGAYITLNIVYD